MTGIERLRELVGGISSITAVCHVTKTSYDREHMDEAEVRLRDLLDDIADQIEDEHAEDCFRMGERAADVSMSAYDLLPEDEREAIAWVRERGGLGAVQARVDTLQDTLDWLREHAGVGKDELVDYDELLDVLDRRLMPEGMEWLIEAWPRFEDDAPVRFGEEAMGFSHKPPFVIDHVTLFDGGEVTVCAEADHDSGKVDNFVRVLPGKRVKRPAPRLDADGVETREGDTVYLLPGEWCDEFPCLGFNGGEELEVFADGEAHHVSGSVQCREKEKKVGFRGICYPQPSQLTHTKPEIDSWERIEEDVTLSVEKYRERYGIKKYDGMTWPQLVREDLVRRCRALAERERGE